MPLIHISSVSPRSHLLYCGWAMIHSQVAVVANLMSFYRFFMWSNLRAFRTSITGTAFKQIVTIDNKQRVPLLVISYRCFSRLFLWYLVRFPPINRAIYRNLYLTISEWLTRTELVWAYVQPASASEDKRQSPAAEILTTIIQCLKQLVSIFPNTLRCSS